MTKEEIQKTAHSITYSDVQLNLKHNMKLVGFFYNNTPNSDMYHSNQWNFTVASTKEKVIIDGSEIESITVF